MKRQPARSPNKPLALRPRRSASLRQPIKSRGGVDEPKTTKPRRRALAIELAAEVERLAGELEASRARIGAIEARIDVDPLTETLNRRGFERELKRSLAYVKRYGASAALVFLDLDDFKPVNDRHGHAAGDAMLRAIAAVLVRNVRASDVVARIGGDEFVVLLWNMRDADAAAKAAALEAAVYATPLRRGVAFIGPLDTPAEVLARADAAMYARKAERRERHSAFGGA